MDKYATSEKLRQAILDNLWERGIERTAHEIAESIHYEYDSVQRALRAMWEHGEVKKTQAARGKLLYMPIASKTYSAEVARHALLEKNKNKPKPNKQPWRTVHKVGDNDKPIKGQGGQGAVRRDVTIKSCMA